MLRGASKGRRLAHAAEIARMNRWKMAGTAALLMLIVAACSDSAGTSATPTPTPVPTPSSSGLVIPSIGNSDQELEKLIPDSVDGVTLQKFSMKGNEFIASASSSAETKAFLDALGVSPEDVAVAFGYGADPSSQSAVAVFVFHAQGAGSDKLITVFKKAADEGSTTYTWLAGSVGGKSVQIGTNPASANAKIYLYATNDDLFFVSTSTEAQATEVLGNLP
jgi:hypothetical protein